MASTNAVTAAVPFVKHLADERALGFVFDQVLAPGDTIATVDNVEIDVAAGDDGSATLTVSGEQTNAAAYTDDEGGTVAADTAVLATVAGGTEGVDYGVTVTVTTETGEVLARRWLVEVRA